MNQDQVPKITAYVLAGMSAIVLFWWLIYNPTRNLTQSLPGLDNRSRGPGVGDSVRIGTLSTNIPVIIFL